MNFGKVKIKMKLKKKECHTNNSDNSSQNFFPVDFFLE
jgi:hypothetical protein